MNEEPALEPRDPKQKPVAVVGIGASAGDLEAFHRLLSDLPEDTGLAIVLVPHLSPDHETLLAELLSRRTIMSVEPATDGVAVEPNHLYVIPPGVALTMEGGGLRLSPFRRERGLRRPIDQFLRSLAEDQKARAVGVILSGTGSDGALGLQAIKERGGITLVQSFESAKYDGMPRAAVATGRVDQVLDVGAIAGRLVAHASHLRQLQTGQQAEIEARVRDLRETICAILDREVHHDFRHYKSSTFRRRVQRRMLVRQVETMGEYVALLERDPEEPRLLFEDLLVSVTAFFRDPEAFDALHKVIRQLVERSPVSERLRVWVPGCATGQEAYSIAMLVVEELERAGRAEGPQIFATDIDRRSLAQAREGLYPEGIAAELSKERLGRFFTREGAHYRVIKALRNLCLFSPHNLVADPPFSNIGLLSCRNVFIYLEPVLQERILPFFHHALRPEGVLFLGMAESITSSELFRTHDKKYRIYEALEVDHQTLPGLPSLRRERLTSIESPRHQLARTQTAERFPQWLLDTYGPPAALVDSDGRVFFMSGRLGAYLEHRTGPTDDNLVQLARASLRDGLERTLAEARLTARESVTSGVELIVDGVLKRIDLIVTPFRRAGSEIGLWGVVFREWSGALADSGGAAPTGHSDAGGLLERELAATRHQLKSTIAELEASNQELEATNEELLSMNEELQSSNEELQRSQEELQSVNEEFESLNTELEHKVGELDRAQADLKNLFESTEIPLLFVDRQLRIARFTPAVTEVLRLIQTDIGRPLADISTRITGIHLVNEVREILATLEARERRVVRVDDEGSERRFLLQVRPYRTLDDIVDGVVLAFIDVTQLDAAMARLRLREEQQAVVTRLGLEALRGDDLVALFEHVVHEVKDTLDAHRCEVLEALPDGKGLLLRAAAGGQVPPDSPTIWPSEEHSQVGETLASGRWVFHFEQVSDPMVELPSPDDAESSGNALTTPIGQEPNTFGVLTARTKRRLFTEDDAHFLQAVANVLASAIQNHHVRRRLAVEHAVAQVLAEETQLEEAVPRILEALSGPTKATVGELWIPETDSERGVLLQCVQRITWDQTIGAGVRAESTPLRVRPGEGLVGTVWETGQPVWLSNLGESGPFVRDAIAEELGLCSGFAIPILQGKVRIGVLGCLIPSPTVPDTPLLQSLERIGHDIGEFVRRVRAEEALRQNQEQLHRALKAAPFPLAIVSDDGEFLLVSDRCFELTGYDPLDPPPLPEWAAHTYGARAERMSADLQRLPATDTPYRDGEYAIRTKTGAVRLWRSFSAPMGYSPEGRRLVITIALDITEKAELERYGALLAAIVDSSADAIISKTLGGKILSWNPAAERLYGYTANEAIGQHISLIMPEDRHDGLAEIMGRVAQGDRLQSFETVRRTKEGDIINVSLTLSPVEDRNGTVVGISAVGRDITARKQTEEQLRQANEQKDRFLAMLGHELRNPLAAIRNVADLLKQMGTDHPELERIRAVLDRQSGNMGRLIDGLLDVSRIARGKVELTRAVRNLTQLVADAIEDRSLEIAATGLDLVLDLPDEPVWVEGDPTRLAQVIDNLLSNAFKFTDPPGTVTVAVRPERGEAVLSVRDTGVGISAELRPYVFEPFRQAAQSLDRAKGGLGLGLAVVRGLIELHGGRVALHSEGPGKGTEFVVRLPTTGPPNVTATAAPRESGSRRVLVVEDNEDAGDVLCDVLEMAGHATALARDGEAALKTAQEFEPELVLCDIGLPGRLSGYDVARAIRREPKLADVKLVALTGYGRPEDRAQAAEAGFDAHLTKPVRLGDLEAVLAGLGPTIE